MLSEISFHSMWNTSRKAFALAIAAVILTTTLVVAPIPGWVPVVGENTESASAHDGYYQWIPGRYKKSPVTRYRQTCVEWQIDYQTDSYVCGRYVTGSYTSYEYHWIPGYNKYIHGSHGISFCSSQVQTTWGSVNVILGVSPEPVTTGIGLVSGTTQVVTAAVFCF